MLVRPPIGEVWIIKQLLDAGAQSLLIPMVETREQAELLVRLNKVEPVIKSVAWASGILLVGLGSFWVYQSFQAPTVL